MQLPVDVKAVIDEATNIEEASQTPLAVSIYIDETAPGDLQAFTRQAFASSSPFARVSMMYFPSLAVAASPQDDMAVIVAGLNPDIGTYARLIREAGVPVMIVTTLPELVCEIAEAAGAPLLKDDVVFPRDTGLALFANEEVCTEEPLLLDPDNVRDLRKAMGEWVVATNSHKRLAFALAFSFVRKPLSLEFVHSTSAQNAGVGLIAFIPGADMPIMTLNQAKMLLQIAASYGQPMGLERVKELAAVVGGGFALRAVARQVVGLVPGFGWAVKAAIGYTGTMAMGQAAVEYFESDGKVEHLAEVASRARDKAVRAAEKVKKQPTLKDAALTVGSSVADKVGETVGRVVPQAASAVDAAVTTVEEAQLNGAGGAVLSTVAGKVGSVARKFTS